MASLVSSSHPVSRRKRIVAGRDRVRIADLPVAAVDHQLAAAVVLENLPSPADRGALCGLHGAGSESPGLLHLPVAVGTTGDAPLISLAHDQFLSLNHSGHFCGPELQQRNFGSVYSHPSPGPPPAPNSDHLVDTGDDGPVVVLLHGVLMGGTLWDAVVDGLRDRYRCIVPELPFGAHTTPMPDDADLSLPALATMIVEFLTDLDLHQVTLVCNDWGGAQLVISPGGTDRVANLVLISCEAFDNNPPGLAGRLLCRNPALPGGTFLTAQLLRPRWIRHLPETFGAQSKRRVPRTCSGAESIRCATTERSAATSPSTSATSPSPRCCSSGPTSSAPSPARSSSSGHDTTSSCPPPTPNDSPTTSRTPNLSGSTTAEPSSLSTSQTP